MKLLEPIQVGKITLKNRIMFPPMTTGYEERDGSIGKQSYNFYKRLAEGGVAYIVLGDVAPVNTVSPTPKLFHDGQIEAFKSLADALHDYDCKLGIQLFHPEYDVDALAELFKKGDMQAARAKLHHDMLHYIDEVTEEQLNTILEKMGDCVRRAYEAGVDVIEVHGDRLVGSLCSTILNHRTDEYGGSFENRTRFALAVVNSIKEHAPDICIDYKLPIVTVNDDGTLRGKGGLIIEEAIKLAKILEEAGVHMIHVGQANHTGNMNDTIPAMGTQPYCFMNKYTKQIKEAVSIPVSSVGRIITPENGETLIENGICDIVGLGRSLLTDPDFVKKIEAGQSQRIRQCMMCNKGCTDAIQNRQFLSCVLNAENGYEYERVIVPATEKKKVVVVGGGPAGLEAARVAKTKGYDVVLFEQETTLGGQLNIACVPPRKSEMTRAIHYLTNEMKELNVDLRLGQKVCAKCILDEKPDSVIVAVGASNVIIPIPGHDLPHVYDAWKVLNHEQLPSGHVVVIGGGLVGAETAELLAAMGCHVTIVEMMEEIAKEESSTVKPTMFETFKKHQVNLLTKTKVTAITATTVEAESEEGTISLPCDYVIMAVGAKPNAFDITPLTQAGIDIHLIGDCHEKASDINHAIEEGYLAANNI
ncbi:bilirubin reductase, long form [Candidatus Stoquefichus massiliensis]|uniref:bilirubin reductase, long form n=1 Tax=Candidatus Stoquefichus massiliensis TaxID=1470350 RepID=UPI00048739E1|nr:bilirubin reductase, long form [Candidatus Stoquefichus massiliensis]